MVRFLTRARDKRVFPVIDNIRSDVTPRITRQFRPSVEAKLQRCLKDKSTEISQLRKTKFFKESSPKIKSQVKELEKVKTKSGLVNFIKKHFKKIPKKLITKDKLTKQDVKKLSFVERQVLGFLRARKKSPIQSRLTILALGVTPIIPLPLAIALTT